MEGIVKVRKNLISLGIVITTLTFLFSTSIGKDCLKVHAKEMNVSVAGELFEFDKSSKYEVDESDSCGNINGKTEYGTFSIAGNMNSILDVNGIDAYEVADSNVVLKYDLQNGYAEADVTNWHLIDDKTKKVNDIDLEADVLSGAIILQTSLTGESWITDVVYTDIRSEESDYTGTIYTSKDIQQVNGCYYRIIVVYELSKEDEVGKSITNWSGMETEYKKCAEVYEFYLINSSENADGATASTATPRKELGTKINTGKDNGYSGNETITNKDPHYGWDLGTFFVNGYTRETTTDDGNSMFLKNVGDRVTLWFNLHEDINCLNGNSNLSIYEDANGYDQYFEIEKTNFKRGTLVISYTDYEGKTHEPIIYTDYLAANARTGANTKVELFEEGDYEVALNYEILNSKGVDAYTNYRIYFKFSIRNGNCMVYPFDIVSGAELSDSAITENGFKLDMAKSRYLIINVKKEVIKSNDNGYYTDERFNRPAKDGEAYSDEGIYTFTVKNLYSDSEPTTKVIYVGTNPVLQALAVGYDLDKINDLLAQGAELKADGTIEMPKVEETIPIEEDVVETTEMTSEPIAVPLVSEQVTESKDVTETIITTEPAENEDKNSLIALVVIVTTVAVIAIYIVLQKRKRVAIGSTEAENLSEESEE